MRDKLKENFALISWPLIYNQQTFRSDMYETDLTDVSTATTTQQK